MSDGQIIIDTRLNTEGADSGLRRLRSEANNLGNSFSNTNGKMNALSGNLNKISKATSHAANTLKPLAVGILGLGAIATKFSMSFENGMHKVYTIADKSVVPVNNMRKAILNLSNQTGISAIDIEENVYDAISAGQKTGDAVNFVSKSTKLATAGFATAGQTLDVLTSIYNAYGQTAQDVTKDSDILIATQNIGKTTVGQLSQNIGLLIPVAKESGVQLNQVGAGLALMTKQGIQTSEAITNYKAMLSELNSTGSKSDKILKKVTGEGFEELIKKGKTVGDIINILNQYASKNNMKLGDMFGNIRSVTGALSLAGNGGKDFNDILTEMNNSTGATENAFKEMSNTTQYSFKKSLNQAKNALIGFGDVLAPFISIASQGISKIAKIFDSMSQSQKKFAVGIGATILGFTGLFFGISKVTGAVSEAINNYRKISSLLKKWEVATKLQTAAQTTLNFIMEMNPIGLWILGITALVTSFIYLWNTSESFRNFWIGLWNGIKNIVSSCVDAILGFFKGLINFIKEDWKQILLFLVNPLAGAFGLLYKHCTEFRNFINNLGKIILNTLRQWGNNVVQFFTQTIPKWINNINKWFMEIPKRIGFALGYAAGEVFKWGRSVGKFFTITIPKWIDFIGKWFSKLPGEIGTWLISTYNKVVAWGSNMIQKAIAVGTKFINNIINWFSQLPGRLWAWLVDTYNRVENWKNQMIQKAIEIASNFINSFINWISQLPNKISDWLLQALNNVCNWGQNLANTGLNAARQLVDSIVNTIKNIPNYMVNIGRDIVSGIWQGIINAKDWIIGKISGFANSIVSGFNSALGIKSPARKLIPTGKYTIQGVGVGMENEMPNLNDQVHTQMAQMVRKMKATVKAQTSAQNFKASFGAMNMSMNKSFKLIGDNEKQPIVINLAEQHVLDGEIIAAHTTHKVIENISENQNSYLISTGGIS